MSLRVNFFIEQIEKNIQASDVNPTRLYEKLINRLEARLAYLKNEADKRNNYLFCSQECSVLKYYLQDILPDRSAISDDALFVAVYEDLFVEKGHPVQLFPKMCGIICAELCSHAKLNVADLTSAYEAKKKSVKPRL